MKIIAITYLLFALGLIFIIKGGDYFVDEATWIARRTGLPEVFIGATIVSIGTTCPEATVSVLSSIQNYSSVAIGNAIGSIICNTGLVLGLHNLIKPSKIRSRIFKYKGIMMLGYIYFLWWCASKGYIDGLSAFGLLVLLFIYIAFNIKIVQYKSKKMSLKAKSKCTVKESFQHIFLFVFGIGLILLGANILVKHGVIIAHHFGVPEAVISLSMIALGTSLPELVTSISALIKGHDELSLGNILGANILNISMVVGLSASINPIVVGARTIEIDIPVAFGLGLILVIPALFIKRVSRVQAFLLLSGYFCYIVALFWAL